MTQSDSGSFTTWSKLKKRNSDNQLRRHPSGNNNNSGADASHLGLTETTIKSQSMPNLHNKQRKKINNKTMLASSGNYLLVKSHQSNNSSVCCCLSIRSLFTIIFSCFCYYSLMPVRWWLKGGQLRCLIFNIKYHNRIVAAVVAVVQVFWIWPRLWMPVLAKTPTAIIISSQISVSLSCL